MQEWTMSSLQLNSCKTIRSSFNIAIFVTLMTSQFTGCIGAASSDSLSSGAASHERNLGDKALQEGKLNIALTRQIKKNAGMDNVVTSTELLQNNSFFIQYSNFCHTNDFSIYWLHWSCFVRQFELWSGQP
mmetsp:Transcript_7983/g.24002  ORF Transcript_7983/g.24002 Transcript_7983/m.24002 type:complete len:131 (-) Transcript_7983:54-446(-)